ncbi:MAG: hypothetical protein LBQ59_02380, partial [Candidatus Peribacteria bacterium]|nr:hypothetical protein [Candidatus Peribacteria bacterium]
GEKQTSSPSTLARGKGVGDRGMNELQNLISISFKILFAFAFAVFSMGVLFRDYIIRIIANEDYILTDTLYNSSDAFLVVF